jgi:hypothetical protein
VFALTAARGQTYNIAASASPPHGGDVQGAGEYLSGAEASLLAIRRPGFGFVEWTENGQRVSTKANYYPDNK